MARNLTRRKASDLAPMPIVGLPDEIRPVAQSLNGLFDRVTAARAGEQASTAFAAHELKTPLAVINTHAQTALIAQDNATRRRALDRIQQGVLQTDRLVRQLLTVAQMDSTDVTDSIMIDVNATVPRVVQDLAGLASLHGVSVEVQCATHVFFNCDDVLLSLALRNLLENAIVASPNPQRQRLRVGDRESGH
ncbi:MAG: histidine kinase dimerization/phospho-acceptor domain-containing protein [Rhodobacterales bacterium]